MLSSKPSTEIKPVITFPALSGSLSLFVKDNKDEPSKVIDTLLKAFALPDSKVAFALDELTRQEQDQFLEGLPLALQIYYGDYSHFLGLSLVRETKNEEGLSRTKKIYAAIAGSPPKLIHAVKVRLAVFNDNANLFWALLKQSKDQVNLAFLVIVENLPVRGMREYDLSGLNLKHLVLCGGKLTLDLRNADLSDAELSCSSLQGSDFRGTKLNRAKIFGSISYANFYGVDLTTLQEFNIGRVLKGTDFREAKLTDGNKHLARTYALQNSSEYFSPISHYLAKVTEHLYNKKKFDVDFDLFVYGVLLMGAESKAQFSALMELVPVKFKVKSSWFFGKKTHAFWQAIQAAHHKMPDKILNDVKTSTETILSTV